MLTIDHIERISASEALSHKYFGSIRQQALDQEIELKNYENISNLSAKAVKSASKL